MKFKTVFIRQSEFCTEVSLVGGYLSMPIDRSEINSKICKAFFSEEELSTPLDFCKNRNDAWKLIHKLEKRGHQVFTKQFPPVYCKID